MAKRSGRYVVAGRVVDARTGRGVAGLRVEAWDKDFIRNDLVGSNVTGAQGGFRMRFNRSYFRWLFLDRKPDLFFKVFRRGELIKSTEDSVLWNVDAGATEVLSNILIEVDASAMGDREATDEEFAVGGVVSQSGGEPYAGLLVRAWDKGLRHERPLGKAQTDASGAYEIRYRPGAPTRKGKAGPDLIVRAFDSGDGDGEPLVVSPVRFRAGRRETIDLVAGRQSRSEYESLLARLTPLLDGATLSELNEADINFLAGESGLKRELIAALVAAELLAALTGLPAPAFYDYSARRRAAGDSELLWERLATAWELKEGEERFRFAAQAAEVVRYDRALVASLLDAHQRGAIVATLELALWGAERWHAFAGRAWDGANAELPPWASGEGRDAKLRTAAALLAGRAAKLFPASLVERRLVSGKVTTQSGRPASGVNVQAFHRGLKSSVAVSSPARSDAGGLYRVALDPHTLRRRVASLGAAPLQLQIRATADEDSDGQGFSEILSAPALPAKLNLSVPVEVGPTEFESVKERIDHVTGDHAPDGLTAEESASWLAGATGLDRETVRRFLDAHRLTARTPEISAEVHYALGHPVARKVGGGPERSGQKLRAAVGAWVVRETVNASAPAVEEWLKRRAAEARAEHIGKSAPSGQPSTAADILTAARLSTAVVNAYVKIIAHEPQATDESLDRLLSDDGVSAADRKTIRRARRLTELVGEDAKLVGRLLVESAATDDDREAFNALARWPVTEWERRLDAQDGVDPANVRRRARDIEAAFEADSPREALLGRLEALAGQASVPDFGPLHDFLREHEGVELRGKGLRFQQAGAVAGADASVRAALGNLQRLARVSSFSQALDLLGHGYASARDVATQTRESFVKQVTGGKDKPSAFDEEEAAAVHRRAKEQYAAALAIAVGLSPGYQGHSPAATGSVWNPAPKPADDAKPDYTATLETLFGRPDACAVEPCQSVLGQPAYFVDLLQLLAGGGVGSDPRAVLFERRGDLGEIKLSCENAETPVPHIDLVIELLEHDAADEEKQHYHQTTWAAEELAAYPEHLGAAAYKRLENAVFPLSLPFNLALTETETYLGDFGLTREELMRRLRKRPRDGWEFGEALVIAAAALGMSRAERDAVKKAAPPEMAKAAAGNVEDFLKQHGLEHVDLVELLAADYVNPEERGARAVRPEPENWGDTCDLSSVKLRGVGKEFLARLHLFVRFWRRTGWTVRELDTALTQFEAGETEGAFDSSDLLLIHVARVKRLASRLNLPVADVLTFWGNLDTAASFDRTSKPPRPRGSQYDRIFQDRASLSREERAKLAWPYPSGTTLASVAAPVRAALGMTAEDFDTLTAEGGPLLSVISRLHRWQTLSKAVGLSIREIGLLRAAGAPDPFAEAAQAERFLDSLDALRRRRVTVEDLVYLLNHEMNATRVRRFAEEALKLLARVRESVFKQAAEGAGDADDEASALLVEPLLAAELARSQGVSRAVASALLQRVHTPAPVRPAAHAFVALFRPGVVWDEFAGLLGAPTPENMSRLAAEYEAWPVYVRLLKGAWLARRLGLTAEELELGAGVRQAPLTLFRLDGLPAAPPDGTQPEAAVTRYRNWLALLELVELRERLTARGRNFWALRAASAGAHPIAESWSKVAAEVGEAADDIPQLVGRSLLSFREKAERASPYTWLRFLDAVELTRRLGVPAARLASWVGDKPTLATAADIRATAAGKRGPEDWRRVAPGLRNRIRERQRSALVAYVVQRLNLGGPEDLHDRYLVDVQMGAQQLTTRLGLAVSSVQQFVRRALHGSERDAKGAPVALSADFEDSWAWMKSYRTWRESRKVFLYPENVLTPELRDDKSPFFVELEQSLSQRDLTDQSIEDALGEYLRKLDDVARMEMMGSCVEERPGGRLLHIVARTRGVPHHYHHRTWSFQTEQFSAWERLDLEIDGDWVLPVIRDGCLTLYWIKHTKQLEGAADVIGMIPSRPFPLDLHYPMYQDQYTLSWSTRLRKKWSLKQTADRHIARPFFPFAPAQFAVRLEGERLRVGGVTLLPPPPPPAPMPPMFFALSFPSWEDVENAGSGILEGGRDAVESAVDFGREVIETGGEIAEDVIDRGGQALGGAAEAWNDLVSEGREAFDENVVPGLEVLFEQLIVVKQVIDDIMATLSGAIQGGVDQLAGDVTSLKENLETMIADLPKMITDFISFLHPPTTLPQRTAARVVEVGVQMLTAVGKLWMHAVSVGLPEAVLKGGGLISAELDGFISMLERARRPGWAGPMVGFEFGYFDVGEAKAKALRLAPPPVWGPAALGAPPAATVLLDMINSLTLIFSSAMRLLYSLFPGYPALFEVPVLSKVLSTDLPVSGAGPQNSLLRGWPGSGYFMLGAPPDFEYVTIAVNMQSIFDEEFIDTAPDLPDLLSGTLSQRFDEFNRFTAGVEATLEDASLANVDMRVVRPIPFGPFPGRLRNPLPSIIGEDRHGRSFLLKPRHVTRTGKPPVTEWDVVALYHPLSATLARAFEHGGVEAVYLSSSRPQGTAWGLSRNGFAESFTVFPERNGSVKTGEAALERLDLAHGGACGLYNWELFYHLPMMFGARLAAQQSFERALDWYRNVFDPSVSSGPAPRRYWRFKYFYDEYEGATPSRTIGQWLKGLSDGSNDEQEAKLIRAWQRDPLNAHLIARTRPGAYERAAVMRTVETLIAWADARFRAGTWEAINEATQLYLTARDLLGERPPLAPARRPPSLTYNQMKRQARAQGDGIDAFGNALLEIEASLAWEPNGDGKSEPGGGLAALSGISMLYFGVPPNEQLLGYWETVDDRLSKIRLSLDIDGKARAASPQALGLTTDAAQAASAYLDSTVAAAPPITLPPYRFQVMLQKAYEFAGDVRAFGGALLSALEKRDAEALARLRAGQEVQVLRAAQRVRELQVEEARQALDAAAQAKRGAELRHAYYSSREFISTAEAVKEALFLVSSALQTASGVGELTAAVLHALPDITVGAGGVGNTPNASTTYGSNQLGNAAASVARALSLMSSVAQIGSTMAGSMAVYERRKEEWDHQAQLAANEMEQHDRLVAGAETRLAVALRELENHTRQVANSQEVAAFMEEKFTREELYDWTAAQLSAAHFQSYLLALDMARRAEACYRFERLPEPARFVDAESWETLASGLLAGERLQQDLRRMESAYMGRNTREYELTKHVSLSQIDPLALLMLRQTGACLLELPERLFDEDHPGQFLRRLKAVSLSIPSVAGPYTPVNCRLTLSESRARIDPSPAAAPEDYPDKTTDAQTDPRFAYFSDYPASISVITTSTGQNDGGLFETNLRDERYLPFEGAGAVGTWHIELPRETNRFDFSSISDVILHLRYTARDGSPELREMAYASTFGVPPPAPAAVTRPPAGPAGAPPPHLRIFSARRDFPDAWRRFLSPHESDDTQTLALALTREHFPFQFRNRRLAVSRLELFLKFRDDVLIPSGEELLAVIVTPPQGDAAAVGGSGAITSNDSVFDGMPYASIDVSGNVAGSPGWSITARKDDVSRLLTRLGNPDAFEQLFILCHYSVEQ